MPNPNPTPKPKSILPGTMYKLPPATTRTNGGISGTGGTNVNKVYKETGTQKSLWQKISYTFRTKPIESSKSLRYQKELKNK
jgi:hypothetical protein